METKSPHTAAKLEAGDLVTENEAAAILGTSVRTLRNWRWQDKPPAYRKIGKRLVRYHRADLAAFAEAPEHRATPA